MTTEAVLRNLRESITEVIRQHADVVVGHDAVHPDRTVCGGVGGCALMRAEHDSEQEVLAALLRAARQGVRLTVEVPTPVKAAGTKAAPRARSTQGQTGQRGSEAGCYG